MGAVSEFRRAIGLSPYSQNTSKSYDLMVQSLLKQSAKTDEAINAYKQAISLDPNNDAYHLNLGNIYFSQSRSQEAFEEYKRAVQLNPVSATNLYSLGRSALSIGQYQEAEQTFREGRQDSPRGCECFVCPWPDLPTDGKLQRGGRSIEFRHKPKEGFR